MATALSYCGSLVREHDPDRFLLSLFVREDFREDLWTLFAFNHEIAKTREVVSETQLGLIRLQWWRDAMGKVYEAEEVLQHEVVEPLAEVIKRRGLSREYFEALIYAREFDLEDVLPSRLEGTLNYVDFTATPLMKLVLQVMGEDPEGGEPVQPVAMNYALIGLLRAVPFYAMQKRCLLPEELVQKYDVKGLYDLKPRGNLQALIEEVSTCFLPDIRPENRFLRASQGLAKIYWKQIKARHYDVFDPKMGLSPAFKELRLWFCSVF